MVEGSLFGRRKEKPFQFYRNVDALDIKKPLPVSEILHREDMINKYVTCLEIYLDHGRFMYDLIVHGISGVGKTLVTTAILEEFETSVMEEREEQVDIIYMECASVHESKLLSDINERLIKLIPECKIKGKTNANSFSIQKTTFLQIMKAHKRPLIIVLDEIDKTDQNHKIIRELSRLNKPDFCYIAITNDKDYESKIKPTTTNALRTDFIEVPKYDLTELIDILKARALHAFEDGVCTDDIIQECAKGAFYTSGDARTAINILTLASKNAYSRRSKKIDFLDVEIAVISLQKNRDLEVIKAFGSPYDLILKSILRLQKIRDQDQNKKSTALTFGNIFKLYNYYQYKQCNKPMCEKTFRKYISTLEENKLISSSMEPIGKQGRSKVYEIVMDLKTLEEYFNKNDPFIGDGFNLSEVFGVFADLNRKYT